MAFHKVNFFAVAIILSSFYAIECKNVTSVIPYGDPCSSTNSSSVRHCDLEQFVTCLKGTCQCQNDDFIYDPSQKKCVVLAGTKTPCSNGFFLQGPPTYSTCVENAGCFHSSESKSSDEGRCSCKPEFLQTPKGLCKAKPAFKEPCTAAIGCRGTFTCNNSTNLCDCASPDGHKLIYDKWQGICVRPLGLALWGPECVSNSQEEYHRHGPRPCKCNNGYTPDKDGICHPSHNTACAIGEKFVPCNEAEGLECFNKQCKCKFGKHQYFLERKCYTLVEGPCGEGFNGSVCTVNSECVHLSKGIHECRCKLGFTPVNGFCQLQYGSKCDASLDGKEYLLRCDQNGGLACIQGVCKCNLLEEYHEAEMKCRGLVGAACNSKNNGFCMDGAFCQGLQNAEGNGVCRCKEGFKLNEDRTCSRVSKRRGFFQSFFSSG